MNATENDHEWFSHQLATYLAGGLSDAAERARFEAHAATCDRCAADLHHAQQLEGKMSELFAVGIPDSDFEQRIATRLRFRLDKRQWVNPRVRKAAIAAAAVLMFGAAGYVAQNFVGSGKLPSLAFFDAKPSANSGSARALAKAETESVRAEQRAMAGDRSAPAQRQLASREDDLPKLRQELVATEPAAGAAAADVFGNSANAAGSTDFPITFLTGSKNGWVNAPFRSAFSLKDLGGGGGAIAAHVNPANSSVDFLTASGGNIVGGAAAYADGSINSAPTNGLYATAPGSPKQRFATKNDGSTSHTSGAALTLGDGTLAGQIVNNGAVVSKSSMSINNPAGGLTASGAETLTLSGKFDMGNQKREVLTTTGNAVFSGALTNGNMNKAGPGTAIQISPGAEKGLAIVSTANDGQMELQKPAPNAAPVPVIAGIGTTDSYTFQGAGNITGDATLRKAGGGTLVIQTNNDYTGGTIIESGTVAMGRDNRNDISGKNDSTVTMPGGNLALRGDGTANLDTAKLKVGNGNEVVNRDGSKALSNFVTSTGTGNLVVDSPSNAITFNNPTSNFSRMTVAAGNVQLNGDNQLSKDGTLGVSGSTGASNAAQRLGQGAVIDGKLELAAGAHSLNIGNIASLTSGGTADMRVNPLTTGSGTMIKTGTGEVLFAGANTLAGTVNITQGTFSGAARSNGNALTSGAVTISGGTLRLNNLGATPGRGSIGSLTFDGGATNPARMVVVDGGNPAGNAGPQRSQAIDVDRGGAGTQIFSGANSSVGGTKFNAGTLTVTADKEGYVNGAYSHNAGTIAPGGLASAGTVRFSTAATPSVLAGSGVSDLDGQMAFKPNTGAASGSAGSLAFDGWKMTGTGSLTITNGTLALSGNGTVSGQPTSGANVPAQSGNPVPAVSLSGPFSLPGINAVETSSEMRAFKPADALAANPAAKPQAGVDASRLPSLGDSGTGNKQLLPSGGQVQLQLQSVGEIRPNQTIPNQSQGSLATRDQLAQAVSQPVGGPAGDANSGRAVAAAAQANAAAARRVIREGTMEFEVDSFDSTFNQIATIVGEEGGFIAAADSDKLPNGKVRGMVTVRVPPDRLDLLVLKLRALGELKSQKLGSRDVGKEYTDIESELRAARAMEARLLEMIAKAQGKVAELLEAEKELATWRTKIEKMTGTLNYYNNLISMATLTLQLYEKDIRTPASANITEEISTGVETEDVEVARNAALKAIDEAKGRIIESNLQKLEAGQFAAKIIAEVAPENAGPIIDRLKQLGRLARYDVQKKQTNEGVKNANGAQSQAPVRLETIPTRIVISLYNLANVAPRLTNNLNIAGDDVEAVYRAILKRVNDVNGRVVSSNLNRQDRAQVTGTMQFEIKAAEADAVLNDVRLQGIVLRMVVNENPDTANVTTAKQAFVLSIIPTAQLSAKQFINMNLAAEDVEAAYGAILKRINASAGSRVISSNLNRQDAAQINGTVQFELKSDDADAVINDLRLQGLVLRMNVGENADGMNVTTVKRSYTLQVVPMATLSPKLTTNLNLAAADVEGMYNSILKIVSSSAGSRVLSSNLSRQDATQAVGSLQFEVKSDEAPAVLNEIRKNVQVLQLNLMENPDNANVTAAKQAFVVQIIPTSQVQPREVRNLGIQTSEVESAVQVLTAAVANVGGRMIDSSLSQDKSGTTVARLAIEVPLDKTEQIADMIRKQGTVRSAESSKNTQIPDGPLSRARLNVTLATGETIVPSEGGFGNSIREGLSTSVKGLLWSLQLIVIGVCLVAPWLLLMWGGWRFLKKRKRATPGV